MVAVVVTVAVAAVVVVAVALTGAVIVTLDIIEVIMVIITIKLIFVVEAEEVTITPGNSGSNRIGQSYALHVAVRAIRCAVAQKF